MARVVLAALALLAFLLLPPAGHALGLGEIRLRSALGQPFAADIPLAVDAPDELRDLKVVLAPAETFARFGLDRPPALADLRFAVEPSATAPVIRVTSTRPVSEPFLSLLLEVSWAKGRLLREYTVLLDPPTFDDRATTPTVTAPPVAARPAAPRPVERAAAVPTPAPVAEAAAGSGDSYGPVRRGDTLSAIARELQPGTGATLNQVMLALYRANPEAFVGNINRLKAGAILRIPSGEAMTGLSRADADGEVRRQVAEWREGAGAGAQAARLQLVPPSPGTVLAGGEAARVGQLEAELAESRRLLELRNRELQSLQQRLGTRGGTAPASPTPATPVPSTEAEAAVERLPGEEPSAAAETAATADGTSAAATAPPRRQRPRADQAGTAEGGLVDTVVGTVFNQWFLGGAALVMLVAYFLYRRRMAGDTALRYVDDPPDYSPVSGGITARGESSPFLVEEGADGGETMTARAIFPPADLEAPLERTISTEGGAQLDQADAIAEADFHSAYGLYDQAAEILNRALRAEPGRRDLRLKLLEVCFSWENKALFLDEARAFRALVGTAGDPDWGKVVVMGRQLCPDDPLFGEPAGDAGVDFSLTGAGTVSAGDLPLAQDSVSAAMDLDLDLTGDQPTAVPDLIDFDLDDAAGDAGARTTELPSLASTLASTMETPTIEAPGVAEMPTMENPALGSRPVEPPTVETPTIESLLDDDVDFTDTDARTTELPASASTHGARTVETPTLESVAPGWVPGAKRRFPDDAAETEEINLDDLGLDLAGLDEAATGLGQAGTDFDLGDAVDASSISLPALDGDTGSLASLTAGDFNLANATGDTAEQPRATVEDTAEQPRVPLSDLSLDSAELAGLDFDLDDEPALPVEPTASLSGRRGAEGPTMTEVGTKLDLARAYIDMGDPDGARSILNEVLEEGDPGQRQEARKLLTELPA